MMGRRHIVRRTSLGAVTVVWEEAGGPPRALAILLPGREPVGSIPGSCPPMESLADRVAAAMEGRQASFPLEELRLDLVSPFARRVLRALHRVPPGRVVTYGELARTAGIPGAARAVGQTMASNPFPIAVPCHRVVRVHRALGGFGGGAELKRELLRREGVRFDPGCPDRILPD